jgi:hypothetical protein
MKAENEAIHMTIKALLGSIRKESVAVIPLKRRIIILTVSLAAGMLAGIAAKYLDGISSSARFGILLNTFANICSGVGIWVLAATLISVFAGTPKAGALHVFFFFIGLLITYYLYSMVLFGFFPTYYFYRWGLMALLSPILAYIVWFGRGQGIIAAVCAALPISFLAAQGYCFIYNFAPLPGFDFIAAILLFIILPSGKLRQYLFVLPLVAILTFIFWQYQILSFFIRGL